MCEGCNGLRFKFINWRRFPKDFVSAIDRLARRIEHNVEPFAGHTRFNGSYSFFLRSDDVLGKLAPTRPSDPKLMVGFADRTGGGMPNGKAYADILGTPILYCLGVGEDARPFWGVLNDPVRDADRIVETMTGFLLRHHKSR